MCAKLKSPQKMLAFPKCSLIIFPSVVGTMNGVSCNSYGFILLLNMDKKNHAFAWFKVTNFEVNYFNASLRNGSLGSE